MRLARGIEFFFGAVASGKMIFAGLHLAGRGQGPNQNFFRVGDLGFGGGFDGGSGARAGGVAQLLAQDGGVDPQLLGDLVREFVAHDPAGDALEWGSR